MNKPTCITSIDSFRDIVLPPGASLHRPDGLQISQDEVHIYVQRGEVVEIRQDGERIGRIRLPNKNDPYTPDQIHVVGQMIEAAKLEHYASAVNWIDRSKDRFWCPICSKNQSHPMYVSCWAVSRLRAAMLLRDLQALRETR